jgi:hypothetical protein
MSKSQSDDDKIPYSVEHSIWLQQQALENHNTGDYLLAKRLYEKALSVFRTELGIDHLITVNCAISAAVNLKQIENFIEAEELIRESLKVMQAKLGMDHPDTLDCLLSLQDVLAVQDKKTEASDIAHTILDLTKKSYGPHHEKTIKAKYELDRILSINPPVEDQEHHINQDACDHSIMHSADMESIQTKTFYRSSTCSDIANNMLNIKETTYSGPDADGDFCFNIQCILKNESDHEIQAIKYSTLILDKDGLCLTGSYNDEEDVCAEPEESVNISMRSVWLRDPSRTLVSKPMKAVVNATLLRGNGLRLGEFDAPQDDGVITQKKDIVLDNMIKTMGVIITRDIPDDESRVNITVSCGIRNITNGYIEKVKLKSALTNNRGEQLDESEYSEPLAPQQSIFLKCTHNIKKNKLREAGLRVFISYLAGIDYQQDESEIANPDDLSSYMHEASSPPIGDSFACNHISDNDIRSSNQDEIQDNLRNGNIEYALFSCLLDLNEEDISAAFHQQYELSLINNKLINEALDILGISKPYIYNTFSYGDRDAEKERRDEDRCRISLNCNNEAIREAEERIKQALIQPDVFSIWRVILLIKAINENYEKNDLDIAEGKDKPPMHKMYLDIRYENPWVISWQCFVTIDGCLDYLRFLNRAIDKDSKLSDVYADGLTTFSFCYLAAALDNDDINNYIHSFTWFIKGERELYGLEARDTGCGFGENLSFVRCALEGFLDMPIEISDDMLSEDGEILDLEDHDWGILADEIVMLS